MPDTTVAADLAKYRLEKARQCLNDAKSGIEQGSYAVSANRSYYCILHAIRAVLAFDHFDSKKHSGLISEFRKRYIKTGIFPTDFSDSITAAFTIRTKSDYDDFYVVAKTDVETQVQEAERFLASIEAYLSSIAESDG
jgi:uncharacterized protein (UPF0332 family)